MDFANSRVYGHAGIDAIDRLAERYKKNDKRIMLQHLSPDCALLPEKAGDLVQADVTDPHYRMAVDELG